MVTCYHCGAYAFLAHPNQIVAEASSTVICSSSLTSAFLPDIFSPANLTQMLVNGQLYCLSIKCILPLLALIQISWFQHSNCNTKWPF